MNLAVLWGAKRLVLIGFDAGPLYGKDHFFGKHPKELRNESPYASFRRNFDLVARDLKALGVSVVNTSIDSHLTCFKKATLADALSA